MNKKYLIIILVVGVAGVTAYSTGYSNKTDYRMRRHVAIYRENTFYCSAVLTSKWTASSAAVCGYYCFNPSLWFASTKQNPIGEYEAIFSGQTIEPIHDSNRHENGPESMRTSTDLCRPDDYERDPMEFVFPAGDGPNELPDIVFANKSMVPYLTKLTLFGYSALTGQPHCVLEQSIIEVVQPLSCNPEPRKGEICAKYHSDSNNCNADLGSPAYLEKDNQTYLVGVVTKQTHGRIGRCTAEDSRLTLALLSSP